VGSAATCAAISRLAASTKYNCLPSADHAGEPPPPFDTGEAAALAALHVSYTNIPITRTMTQAQFNIAATQAAIAYLNAIAQGPGLIHCSTGDRASSVFAVALIGAGLSNTDAVSYACNSLLLANSSMIALVQGYTYPNAEAERFRAAAAAALSRP